MTSFFGDTLNVLILSFKCNLNNNSSCVEINVLWKKPQSTVETNVVKILDKFDTYYKNG